jgi:hypothetical protein
MIAYKTKSLVEQNLKQTNKQTPKLPKSIFKLRNKLACNVLKLSLYKWKGFSPFQRKRKSLRNYNKHKGEVHP